MRVARALRQRLAGQRMKAAREPLDLLGPAISPKLRASSPGHVQKGGGPRSGVFSSRVIVEVAALARAGDAQIIKVAVAAKLFSLILGGKSSSTRAAALWVADSSESVVDGRHEGQDERKWDKRSLRATASGLASARVSRRGRLHLGGEFHQFSPRQRRADSEMQNQTSSTQIPAFTENDAVLELLVKFKGERMSCVSDSAVIDAVLATLHVKGPSVRRARAGNKPR